MTTINLHKANDINIDIQFPTEWNDCTLDELQLITASIFLKKHTDHELLVLLIKYRLQQACPTYKKTEIQRIILLLNIEDLALNFQTLLSFIYNDIKLTQQPLPTLAGLHGPESDFLGITNEEFEDAEACLISWLDCMKDNPDTLTNNNLTHVCEMVAVLWRPTKKAYEGYKPNGHTKNLIKSIKPELLYIALFWFMGCKAELPEAYPNVYGKGEGVIIIGEYQVDTMAFTKLIHHGAGPKNGTRADIRRMRLREFLFDLNLSYQPQPQQPE